ncbi:MULTISPECIES: hypothetical protein [unclassified Emergencia]|uniref:hypothetical protein n=1 Tax=unclassified Emergencia TaxID=2642996 RepID=UPI001379B15F|nr:hypothetical protein [Emergencia sp. 1XD21-10]NCE99360.1 hypothetical protein [Emergencia sp. 1XD21-10]
MLVRVFQIACVVGIVISIKLDHKMVATVTTILLAAVLVEAFFSDWKKSRKTGKTASRWMIIVENFCGICAGLLLIAYIWAGQIWVFIPIAIILGLGVLCDIRLRKKKSTEEE